MFCIFLDSSALWRSEKAEKRKYHIEMNKLALRFRKFALPWLAYSHRMARKIEIF